MTITADMFVGATVAVVMIVGATMLRKWTHRKSLDAALERRALERDVYSVSWLMFAVGFAQFALAGIPIAVLVLSPNPGLAGYIVFGGMSLGWALFGVWFIRNLRRTSVVFEDRRLVYHDGRRERVLLYDALTSVGTSSGYIVCSGRSEGPRFVIPMQFSGSAMILARLRRICAERANQALQPTPMLVTPRADARVAPSTGVADL